MTEKSTKITYFKSCTNKDIADAVMSLAQPMLAACANELQLEKQIITLTVIAWNLSLFPVANDDYTHQISAKIPEDIPSSKRDVFKAFIRQVIEVKKIRFPDMLKGITAHQVTSENNELSLTVEARPVDPRRAPAAISVP